MKRVSIDGVIYEKEPITNWEQGLDPKGFYIIYLKNMYKLERVKDRPRDVTEELKMTEVTIT